MQAMQKLKETFKRFKPLHVIVGVVIVLLIGVAGFFFWKYQQLTAGSREIQQLKTAVGKLYEVPDETPTLATVVDKEQLKDQNFFAKSQNGDKVLIFPTAKKAVLYRPSTNKIIEIAPFLTPLTTELTTPGTPTTPAPVATPVVAGSVKVLVLNGTTSAGLAKKFAPKIEETNSSAKVSSTSQAKKTPYATTIVADVTGKNAELAQQLAKALDAEVKPLPESETAGDAEIVVILGDDKK